MTNYQNFYHSRGKSSISDRRINRAASRLSETRPFFEIVGNNRISSKMRYSCPDEIIYDSFVPNISQLLATEGAYPNAQYFFVSSSVSSQKINVGVYLFSNQPATWMSGSVSPVAPTINSNYYSWFKSFPFESKYSNVPRSLPSLNATAYDFTGNEFLVSNITFQIPIDVESTSTTEAGKRWMLYDELFEISSSLNSLGSQTQPPTQSEVYKFFFGIGDNLSSITGSTGALKQSFVDMPTFFQIDSPFVKDTFLNDLYPTTLYRISGMGIRGWKYGIYNALPTSTSCVFRRNSYGQFRDMLEQRPHTVFYDPTANKPLSGPVEVKFVKMVTGSLSTIISSSLSDDGPKLGSYVIVNPSETDTFNKSTFATSSLPYFDL